MKLKAHLFPHTYLPEMMIEKIISLFGPVRIYQPWFLDPKGSLMRPGLEAVTPQDNLKPGADIKAMLSGYRQWFDQNRDKGIREFLRVSEKARPGDSSTWEIRQLLKSGAVPSAAGKGEETTLRWHVLLHLADEVERRNFEIAEMMNALKKRGSVLAGVLQDPDETKSFFDDMQGLDTADSKDGPDMGLVLNAWFGLFGGYLEKDSVLITCSRHVMDSISTQWDEAFAKNNDASPLTVSFYIPSPSSSELQPNDKMADTRAAVMKLRELIFGFGEDPIRCMNGLKVLAGELEETQKPSEEASNISLKHFPANEKIAEGEGLLKDITGKTIIYFSPE
jgi:hypothetical protein